MPFDRPPQYDVLFEPVRIGPKLAKNRFYQVPHCNGGGYRDPSAAAEMRRTKAEGGWGVIFTEQTEIHHSSEITPYIEQRLWDDRDIPALARMAEAMKSHGALAGIQFAYSGINGPNLYTREVPLAVTGGPILTFSFDPVQARSADLADIADMRRWFVNAAKRAQRAGFDLICLYGAHGFGIFQHFLSRATNFRSDEYGGSLENRARFLREVIADTKEAVGDRCAGAHRHAVAALVVKRDAQPHQLHQPFRSKADHLAQYIGVGGLLQHAEVGGRDGELGAVETVAILHARHGTRAKHGQPAAIRR